MNYLNNLSVSIEHFTTNCMLCNNRTLYKYLENLSMYDKGYCIAFLIKKSYRTGGT